MGWIENYDVVLGWVEGFIWWIFIKDFFFRKDCKWIEGKLFKLCIKLVFIIRKMIYILILKKIYKYKDNN